MVKRRSLTQPQHSLRAYTRDHFRFMLGRFSCRSGCSQSWVKSMNLSVILRKIVHYMFPNLLSHHRVHFVAAFVIFINSVSIKYNLCFLRPVDCNLNSKFGCPGENVCTQRTLGWDYFSVWWFQACLCFSSLRWYKTELLLVILVDK